MRSVPTSLVVEWVMAQWEATIRAQILIRDEDGDDCQFSEQYVFMWSGPDFITTMMSIQSKLDVLNQSQKQKWDADRQEARFLEEFQVVGLIETDHIVFGDRWINEYVERGVISRHYAEDE